MLSNDELHSVLNKKESSLHDLELMSDHVKYISDLKDEYGEDMPLDVARSLQKDLESIIIN